MAVLQKSTVTALLLAVILMEFALVQARICVPDCGDEERCVAADPRERRGYESVCVPIRCLTRARRGRCHHHDQHFAFDRATLSCEPLVSGACYGHSNRFSSRENCELACSPWYR